MLREDPARRGLLFCGTELGLLVSFDDGASWQRCQGELPRVPVHDFVFKGDDLVVATHGRSIWILEDLPALREHRPELDSARAAPVPAPSAGSLVYRPGVPRERRVAPVLLAARAGGGPLRQAAAPRPDRDRERTGGARPNATEGRDGAVPARRPGDAELRLTFRDSAGQEVRTLTARPGDEDRKPEKGKPKDPVPPRREGLNRFVWDGRHGPGTQIEIDPPDDEDARQPWPCGRARALHGARGAGRAGGRGRV